MALNLFPLFTIIFLITISRTISCSSPQVYVVYMGNRNGVNTEETILQNHQLLSTIHDGSMEKAKESHVYSYSNSFRGFAALLTEDQASDLAEMTDVVSVFPNTRRILHTTHSWDFMGIGDKADTKTPGGSTKNQEDVIVGIIDTGIWPESPSFDDRGMPEVPKRWRGKCQSGESFSKTLCNKKLIGARYYLNGYEAEERSSKDGKGMLKYKSARDSAGHGTHTASTAAGRYVAHTNFSGLAAGSARGGAPEARIAAYKACWAAGCYDADLLAAFDDAIGDGVDILSLSLGPEAPQGEYFRDAISIGTFHAVSRGVLVVASAGNAGDTGTVTNVAPWMFTVGASSTDRNFVTEVVFDNGLRFTGESLNAFKMDSSAMTILAEEANAGYFTPYQSSYCVDSSIDEKKAKGKILVCRYSGSSSESRMVKSMVAKRAGAVGMILIDETEQGIASAYAIPGVSVSKSTGEKIVTYLMNTRGAKSRILHTNTVLGSRSAPRATTFSSKGPNSLTPEILKPDIMAPGLNILAAWSPALQKLNFNIISGTSMACPHITGLAALIKAANPSWSPAAIKSAIMTTATTLNKNGKTMTADPEGNTANPFDFGSGFPDLTRVLNPGLIYDADESDYKAFLCSTGYDNKTLQTITGGNTGCDKIIATPSDLNYPSITVPELHRGFSVSRSVVNVGSAKSEYRAVVSSPDGVDVKVSPDYIKFGRFGEKKTFTVKFTAASSHSRSDQYVFGSLAWKEVGGDRVVTSPLVVRKAVSDTGIM